MKKQLKTISLKKETLRALAGEDLQSAAGGSILPRSQVDTCRCPTAISCQHVGFC